MAIMDFRFVLIPAIAILLGLVSLLLAARAWRGWKQVSAARIWLQTPGRVVESGIHETAVRVRRQTSASSTRRATRYAPRIVYAYTVHGTGYQGERLRFGPVTLSSEAGDAERAASRYPPGSEVTVYYDPVNPAESALDLRPGWGIWLEGLLALFLLLVDIAVIALLLSGPAS